MLRRQDTGAQWRERFEQDAADAAAQAEARAKPVHRDVASYLAAHPECALDAYLRSRPASTAFIPVLTSTRWTCTWPGNYLIAWIWESPKDGSAGVRIGDYDDSCVGRVFRSRAEAERVLEDVLNLGALDLPDLVEAMGFSWE